MTAEPEANFDVHVFACAESPRVSTAFASGWKAYRIDDPELDEPPQLAFTAQAVAAVSSEPPDLSEHRVNTV
jgi:hypothetical protein